jgi:sugar phosphate permease
LKGQTDVTVNPPPRAVRKRSLIFSILAFGYILVYFHRLCPAVVAVDMMRDLHASGALLGFLGSAYFYPYALMQIPTGLLSDSWGPRRAISTFLVLAGAGSLILGVAPTTAWAVSGRILVGLGVSTLFISTLKVLSEWFHSRDFATMTGVLMAVGGIGSLMAAAPLAYMSEWLGWRFSFLVMGGLTLLVALLVRVYVRDKPADVERTSNRQPSGDTLPEIPLAEGFRMVLKEPAFRPLAVWFFFTNAIYFSFIGLWGGPYLMHVYGAGKGEAGRILSMSAIGIIIGGPLLSRLSDRVFRGRKPVIVLSSFLLFCLTGTLAFATGDLASPLRYLVCMGIGCTTAAVAVIGFTAVKELFPLRIAGTATGLVNLFPFAGGALFQPFLGFLLERNGRIAGIFTIAGYREAFIALFVCGCIAFAASLFIRETMPRR